MLAESLVLKLEAVCDVLHHVFLLLGRKGIVVLSEIGQALVLIVLLQDIFDSIEDTLVIAIDILEEGQFLGDALRLSLQCREDDCLVITLHIDGAIDLASKRGAIREVMQLLPSNNTSLETAIFIQLVLYLV